MEQTRPTYLPARLESVRKRLRLIQAQLAGLLRSAPANEIRNWAPAAPPAFETSLPGRKHTRPDGLTRREVEVLQLLARGETNRAIAATLVLSVYTVERHIVNLYAKIGARGRADAIVYALRHGPLLCDPVEINA